MANALTSVDLSQIPIGVPGQLSSLPWRSHTGAQWGRGRRGPSLLATDLMLTRDSALYFALGEEKSVEMVFLLL